MQLMSKFELKNELTCFYSRHSFESIESWIKELKMNSSPDIKIFLIGNKSDLEEHREVQFSE